MSIEKPWFVYIVRCADASLYCGVCTDLQRRLYEHNSDNRLAAKYTRSRRPVELVYVEQLDSRSTACQREAEIKGFSRAKKLRLIQVNSLSY